MELLVLDKNIPPTHQVEEHAAILTRLPIEWIFGDVDIHFPFVHHALQLKINEREVGTYYLIACLLTNIHSCLYGNNACVYFSNLSEFVHPPNLNHNLC